MRGEPGRLRRIARSLRARWAWVVISVSAATGALFLIVKACDLASSVAAAMGLGVLAQESAAVVATNAAFYLVGRALGRVLLDLSDLERRADGEDDADQDEG